MTVCRNGPNAKYLGGIGADLWHFNDADSESWQKGLVWFAIDSLCMLATFFFANRSGAKIHKILANQCSQYGAQLMFGLAFMIDHQICITVFHCAMEKRTRW